jgi:hypothetical protein
MKASRAVVAAALCAMTLGVVSESASARGGGGGHGRGSNVSVGVWGPGWSGGAWRHGAWGPGVWRGSGWVSSGWWGPGVWGPGWWGPGVWGPGVWGPGVWSTGVWGPSVAVVSSPQVVMVPSEPRVFVERDAPAAPAAQPQQWWYWCQSAQGYYPYVSTCSEGWRRVEPQVPQGQQ